MKWNQLKSVNTEVEKLAANEEDIIDEAQLPLINEGKVSVDVFRSAELNANNESIDNIDSSSDRLQVPVTLEGEVLRPAGLGEKRNSGITNISVSSKTYSRI